MKEMAIPAELLRPMSSKGAMVLPRLLLFLTICGGLQVVGPIGLLLGPLAGSLAGGGTRNSG